jgi:uncharacterized protein with PCYCGC motif
VSSFDDVFGLAAARVEEEARGQRADEDRGGDGQQDAGGNENERERVDLHDRQMVGRRAGAEVGPKVTTLLGRRRFLAAAGLLIASACAPAASKAAEPTPVVLPALGADPKNGIWPAEYLRAAAPVREAYSWAIAHEPTLRYIPCYCGCGADGHTSNYSCYVRQVLAGGRVILDPHGFG